MKALELVFEVDESYKRTIPYTKSELVKDSTLSLVIPFYNNYLVNRAQYNKNRAPSLFRKATNVLLIGAELGFIFGCYGLLADLPDGPTYFSLVLGGLSRTKGIAWGSFMEYDWAKEQEGLTLEKSISYND